MSLSLQGPPQAGNRQTPRNGKSGEPAESIGRETALKGETHEHRKHFRKGTAHTGPRKQRLFCCSCILLFLLPSMPCHCFWFDLVSFLLFFYNLSCVPSCGISRLIVKFWPPSSRFVGFRPFLPTASLHGLFSFSMTGSLFVFPFLGVRQALLSQNLNTKFAVLRYVASCISLYLRSLCGTIVRPCSVVGGSQIHFMV